MERGVKYITGAVNKDRPTAGKRGAKEKKKKHTHRGEWREKENELQGTQVAKRCSHCTAGRSAVTARQLSVHQRFGGNLVFFDRDCWAAVGLFLGRFFLVLVLLKWIGARRLRARRHREANNMERDTMVTHPHLHRPITHLTLQTHE